LTDYRANDIATRNATKKLVNSRYIDHLARLDQNLPHKTFQLLDNDPHCFLQIPDRAHSSTSQVDRSIPDSSAEGIPVNS
jgi:hypothetical protein